MSRHLFLRIPLSARHWNQLRMFFAFGENFTGYKLYGRQLNDVIRTHFVTRINFFTSSSAQPISPVYSIF